MVQNKRKNETQSKERESTSEGKERRPKFELQLCTPMGPKDKHYAINKFLNMNKYKKSIMKLFSSLSIESQKATKVRGTDKENNRMNY